MSKERDYLSPTFTRLIQPMGFLIILAVLMVIFALCAKGQAQTLTLQSGVGASSNLGTRPGPVVEARLEHPWIYARGRFSWEKKDYLNSGSILTADLMPRFTGRRLWAGVGVEISHASTREYQKTALRLLFGAGYKRPQWSAAVFAFAPESGTQNKSSGVRGELDLVPWRSEGLAFVITARPYLLRYHNGPEWERVRIGSGLDLLAGVRFGK